MRGDRHTLLGGWFELLSQNSLFVCHFIHTSIKLRKNIIKQIKWAWENSFRYQYRERFLILLNSFLVPYCIYLTKPMNHASVISSVRANSVTTALLLNVWVYPEDRVPAVGLLCQRVCINTLPHSQTRPKCSPKEIALIYFPPQNVWARLTQKHCHTCDRRYYQSVVRGLEVQGAGRRWDGVAKEGKFKQGFQCCWVRI